MYHCEVLPVQILLKMQEVLTWSDSLISQYVAVVNTLITFLWSKFFVISQEIESREIESYLTDVSGLMNGNSKKVQDFGWVLSMKITSRQQLPCQMKITKQNTKELWISSYHWAIWLRHDLFEERRKGKMKRSLPVDVMTIGLSVALFISVSRMCLAKAIVS